MRLIRIRLRDFRGTVDREIHFDERLTVVEGPNEVGKSTLTEALRLLLDHDVKSDSRKQSVERIRPIGRDVVPEIEAELESPPYRFVFRKRFSPRKRDGGTELELLAPQIENLSGDAASARLRQILDETLDVDLFKALQIQQGTAIASTALPPAGWLGEALDRAAGDGDRQLDDAAESLYERARAEALRYRTEKTGSETRELAARRSRVDEAKARADALRERLRKVEAAIHDHARLVVERRQIEARLPELEAAASAQQREVAELEALARDAAALEQRLAASTARRAELAASRQRREDSARRLAALDETLVRDRARRAIVAVSATEAIRARDAARDAQRRARARREAAEGITATRAADLERVQVTAAVARLRAQRDRVAVLLDEQRALRNDLARAVDDQAVSELLGLEAQLAAARTSLERDAASLTIDALAPLDVLVDGQRRQLAAGEQLGPGADGRLELLLPELLRLRFDAGEGAEPLRSEVDRLDRARRAHLAAQGVASIDELRERAQTARDGRARERAVEALLDELVPATARQGRGPLDALDDAIADAAQRIQDLFAQRAVPLDEPADEAAARALLDAAQAAQREAGDAEQQCAEQAECHADAERESARQLAQLDAGLDSTARRVSDERARLAVETSGCDDATLARELAEVGARCEGLAADAAALRARLSNADLDARRQLAQSAKDSVDTQRARLQTNSVDLRGRADVLRHEEGEGLAEQLAVAEAELATASEELDAVLRRAAAAELLFTTLRAERSRVRASYVRPLSEQIDRLGRLVFGEDFHVTLDDGSLRIVARTLGGLRVPFEDLSVGAREQLDLLMRIAVAITVADQGGVPLILDDTLGSADPVRLRAMNGLLAFAAQRVQVIVLTCQAERFDGVGDASFVRLSIVA